jgi:integrase
VRRKGSPSVTRSFLNKSDAQIWARQTELEVDRVGLPVDRKALERFTLGDIFTRYRDEVIPKKRGRNNETIAVNAFLRHKLSRTAISELTLTHVAVYRDERLKTVKASTLNRQLDIFRHALEVARKDWALPLSSNPFALITRPKIRDARERRLQPGEWERLVAACRQCRGPYLLLMVELALETAMRRGELLNAKWRDVSLNRRTLHIPLTKNDYPRTIPLTARAIALLGRLKELNQNDEQVIPISLDSMKMAWKRVLKRAKLDDLHFHDLRHEAISRFFEHGLSIPEVAMISGHRDPRMLFRYTHPKPELVAEKLAKAVVS